jgi:uncharacterized membrane protein YgaE (UPF0421/DUF939 family)
VTLGDGWRAAIQTGAAAGLSWWIASEAIGHAAPLSAPVVAAISIGATTAARWRRMVDVVLGLSIGIGLATLLVAAFGRGALLLALVVTAAMLTAAAARGGELLVMQAGVAAILIFAADADSTNAVLARFVDALIGGGCAGLVSLFVLPPDPTRLLTARVHALLAELEAVLADIAEALRRRSGDQAAAALERARGTDELVAALHAARPVALEVARLVPLRRAALPDVRRVNARAPHLDHAVRHTRVLARAALASVASGEGAHPECAAVCEQIGLGVRRLDAAWTEARDAYEVTQLAARIRARAETLQAEDHTPSSIAVMAAARGVADDLTLAAAASPEASP